MQAAVFGIEQVFVAVNVERADRCATQNHAFGRLTEKQLLSILANFPYVEKIQNTVIKNAA